MWMRRFQTLCLGMLLVPGVAYLVKSSSPSQVIVQTPSIALVDTNSVDRVNAYFEQSWAAQQVVPSPLADELTLLRRLSLALHGTIPSLEEVRQFQTDTSPDRIDRWTQKLLDDPRFGVYFAERFAKVFTGADDKPFGVFREDRFQQWLAEQIQSDRPYDQWVRELITQSGLWTGEPAVNFITAAFENGTIDTTELTSRTMRAFVGQRIDCAQCHDHPFAVWKQADYEGLASFYGDCHLSIFGIYDGDPPPREQLMMTEEGAKPRTEPAVPFHAEHLPATGTTRDRLAGWITHPENRRFHRASVNRVWGLLFGIPYSEKSPLNVAVDDLPDPYQSPIETDLLELLAEDFQTHECRLKHLIITLTSSQVFRLSSETQLDRETEIEHQEAWWGRFPLSRLRPEQVIGAMAQTGSLSTIDQNSHLVTRMVRLLRERDFVREYGPITDEELTPHGATIPQVLLRMNGRLVSELLEANPFNASSRLANLSPSNAKLIESAFLITLTRKPTTVEADWFADHLLQNPELSRTKVSQDLLWTLINSEEFNWNH